jgi:uncharacterized repeat protein (TIGR01451 family)
MATIITNQATINYKFGTVSASAVSNITSAAIVGSFEIEKTSLNNTYRIGENITYIITLKNNGSVLDELSVTDDLGSFEFNNLSLKALDFVGPAELFINGNFISTLIPVVDFNGITFKINNFPAGGTAQIIYLAKPNAYAGICCGDEIENSVTAECNCPCNNLPLSTSNVLIAECFADVRIAKSVCPNPIVCGDEITYMFDITNYGNIDATDVVLTDTFEPPLTDLKVYLDAVELSENDYTYVNGTLTIPSPDGELDLTIAAATCERDPQTGETSLDPGNTKIIVMGKI